MPEEKTESTQREHRPSRRRPLIFGIALLAIALTAAYTVRYFHYAAGHPSTDDAFVQGDTVSISSKIFGRVIRVLVQGDQHVSQGQLLVTLDPTDAQIAVQQAEATLLAAKTRVLAAQAALVTQRHQTIAGLAQAQAGVAAAGARVPQAETSVILEDRTVAQSISMAQAQLSAAEANALSARSVLTKAQNDLTRARELFAQGAAAAQQVDEAQAAYALALAQKSSADDAVEQARAALAAAQATQLQVPIRQQDVATAVAQHAQAAAGLESARTGFDVVVQREAELKSAQAAVAQAEAALAAARQQLDETRIVAPTNAVVASQVSVEPGQIVQPNQPLLTLVFTSHKWVEANFKETQLRNVRVGQPATVRIDLLGQTFRAHVERLGPATGAALSLLPPQNATGNYTKVVQRVPIRIALDEVPENPLQVGLSVEVTVDTTRRPGALATTEVETKP